jgi:ABC-type branched-subunit amino acid transport system ATPase component
MTAVLEASGLSAGYGAVDVIRDVNLEVEPGQVLALLGANGAGKTTTLMTLAGAIKPRRGTVTFLGEPASGPLHQRARKGLSVVPERRAVFTRLTTRQNIAIGRGTDLDRALAIFPELEPLLSRRGGLLSGGEQQMLVMARALARPTKVLLADEVSLGLAPLLVSRLMRAVRDAADQGIGAIIVEQHVHRALEIADRVCVLRQGQVEFSGTADEAGRRLMEISKLYLGRRAANTGT